MAKKTFEAPESGQVWTSLAEASPAAAQTATGWSAPSWSDEMSTALSSLSSAGYSVSISGGGALAPAAGVDFTATLSGGARAAGEDVSAVASFEGEMARFEGGAVSTGEARFEAAADGAQGATVQTEAAVDIDGADFVLVVKEHGREKAHGEDGSSGLSVSSVKYIAIDFDAFDFSDGPIVATVTQPADLEMQGAPDLAPDIEIAPVETDQEPDQETSEDAEEETGEPTAPADEMASGEMDGAPIAEFAGPAEAAVAAPAQNAPVEPASFVGAPTARPTREAVAAPAPKENKENQASEASDAECDLLPGRRGRCAERRFARRVLPSAIPPSAILTSAIRRRRRNSRPAPRIARRRQRHAPLPKTPARHRKRHARRRRRYAPRPRSPAPRDRKNAPRRRSSVRRSPWSMWTATPLRSSPRRASPHRTPAPRRS